MQKRVHFFKSWFILGRKYRSSINLMITWKFGYVSLCTYWRYWDKSVSPWMDYRYLQCWHKVQFPCLISSVWGLLRMTHTEDRCLFLEAGKVLRRPSQVCGRLHCLSLEHVCLNWFLKWSPVIWFLRKVLVWRRVRKNGRTFMDGVHTRLSPLSFNSMIFAWSHKTSCGPSVEICQIVECVQSLDCGRSWVI